jgi:hypothetical protein
LRISTLARYGALAHPLRFDTSVRARCGERERRALLARGPAPPQKGTNQMSNHDKQKPMDDKRKPTTDDKNKQPQQQPMPRAHERDRQAVPGERSDKESIGQPVQLDEERQ